MQSNSENTWSEQSQSIIDYYEFLIAESERDWLRDWLLGLFMSHYWLRLIEQQSPDADEIRLFYRTLKLQKMNQGSGWHDLTNRVSFWAQAEHGIG